MSLRGTPQMAPDFQPIRTIRRSAIERAQRWRGSATPAGTLEMARGAQAECDRDDRFGRRSGRDAGAGSGAIYRRLRLRRQLRGYRRRSGRRVPDRRHLVHLRHHLLVHRRHYLRPGAGDELWPARDYQLRDWWGAHRQLQHVQRHRCPTPAQFRARLRVRARPVGRPALRRHRPDCTVDRRQRPVSQQ